jgi:hypothetical protein
MNIKKRIKEELNKTLLLEKCTVIESPLFDIVCPDGEDGKARSVRLANCSWKTFTNCGEIGPVRGIQR